MMLLGKYNFVSTGQPYTFVSDQPYKVLRAASATMNDYNSNTSNAKPNAVTVLQVMQLDNFYKHQRKDKQRNGMLLSRPVSVS